jgi:hypothetical protein
MQPVSFLDPQHVPFKWMRIPLSLRVYNMAIACAAFANICYFQDKDTIKYLEQGFDVWAHSFFYAALPDNPSENWIRIANVIEILRIGRIFSSLEEGSSLPLGINVVDLFNHSVNLYYLNR